MGFQRQVNTSPAPAVWGDWASRNPRATFDAGPGGLVAGSNTVTDPIIGTTLMGVVVGRFAWATPSPADPDGGPTIVNNTGVGQPTGIVHREEQAAITQYLADSTMVIPQGFMVVLMTAGVVWAKNEGTTECVQGMQAVVSYANGAVSFQAAGGSAPSTSASTSTIAAGTAVSASGYLTGNTLTITLVSTGTIYAGMTISGSGIATGTQIVAQMSGTAGGVGTYSVNIPEQSAGSPSSTITISGTPYILTLGAAPTNGNFVVGGLLSGGSIGAGVYATQLISGTGGNGSTFATNATAAQASATITASMRQGARTDLAQTCAMSQADAAAALNVSRRSVQYAKEVRTRGVPGLVVAVERGQVAVWAISASGRPCPPGSSANS